MLPYWLCKKFHFKITVHNVDTVGSFLLMSVCGLIVLSLILFYYLVGPAVFFTGGDCSGLPVE